MIINVGAGAGDKAEHIKYENDKSGLLNATNVQEAVDELAGRITFSNEEPTTVPENGIVMVYEE